MLLLSRETLTPAEADRARALARSVTDWPMLVRTAMSKRCLPFVYRHVAALDLLPPEAPLRQEMKQITLVLASRWLSYAQAHRVFVETCLAPHGTPHLFFKGVSLARYYAQPSLRTSRDIDVLVRQADVRPLIERATDAGYRVILDRRTGHLAKCARDVEAVLRYKRDVPLVSPEGIPIEVHADLWHGADFVDSQTLLDRAETCSMAGIELRVMPTAELFVYLCHHHNRHLWSSLNWLADISAIRSAPDFDEARAWSVADRFALREVVEATLAFDDLSRGRPSAQPPLARARAEESRRFCLMIADGHVDTERGLYFERIDPTDDWRASDALHETVRHRAWRSRLTPNLDQYQACPLPLWLHWLYPLGRAIIGARRAAGRER
ncbi:nucleotidyltransferase family protein [Roseitranquillus sediminis]|uniref:nucleotidyltransferase family protein n=1 Tax=Roseitranquillus sediminis TaxID=2809051 RepID=UPI001D0C18FC|nr:nucleotidyltransferase family protein [Roseitranquillus sediminis]MBM9594022.1 nucleotidyltransferase family protein [Roseitranquillus sediminis]